ncbi:MAG: hypothetical protein KGL34_08115 [Gammaproteobacteria bacterium]|nr:hypothetical protein [Gammaproteobacteria bacterium]
MYLLRMAILSVPLAASLGCSSGEAPPAGPPAKTVFDPLTRQEARASAVQQTLDQYARDQRRAIDAAEGGDASR